jgi:hypothetical protein
VGRAEAAGFDERGVLFDEPCGSLRRKAPTEHQAQALPSISHLNDTRNGALKRHGKSTQRDDTLKRHSETTP